MGVQIKEELRRLTEAYEEGKTHATSLYNEFVEQQQSQFTNAVKINELREEKEALIKELQDAKAFVDQTKVDPLPQRFSTRSGEEVVKAKEQEKHPLGPSSYVPRFLRKAQSSRTVDTTWPKDPEDDNDGFSSVGEVTPASSNDPVQFTNTSLDAFDMCGSSGDEKESIEEGLR